MKQLWSASLSNLSTTYNLNERGSYGLFMLRFTGTAQAGQTVALPDLGNVKLNWNGEDIVNVPASILSALDNVYGGAVESTSNIGGSFAFSIIIPTGLWFDNKNIYEIGNNDKVYFNLSFPNMVAGLIVSGTVEISGLPKRGQMNYFHKLLSRNIVSAGASTITDTIVDKNISEVYLVDPATLMSNIQLVKDNKVIYDGSVGTELAYSNWIHQLESTVTTLALEFVTSGNVQEALGSGIDYKYTFSGGGTQEQYYSAVELINRGK